MYKEIMVEQWQWKDDIKYKYKLRLNFHHKTQLTLIKEKKKTSNYGVSCVTNIIGENSPFHAKSQALDHKDLYQSQLSI